MEYFGGYLLALILTVINLSILIKHRKSIKTKNMEKVWLNFSLLSGSYVETEKESIKFVVFIVIISLIINPLLSWLMVIYYWYKYWLAFYWTLKTPEKLKELQFKLENNLYNKEEVINILQEIADFSGKWKNVKDIINTNNVDDEENTLVVDQDEYSYAEITILSDNRFEYYYRQQDYMYIHKEENEFKIENNKLFSRVINSFYEEPWNEYYDIQDNTVIKSEIRKRFNKNYLSWTLEWNIIETEKKCEWNEIKLYKIKYFLFEKSKTISIDEKKKYLREELENLKEYVNEVQELAKENNLTLEYNIDFDEYVLGWDMKDKTKEKFYSKADKISKKYNLPQNYFVYIQSQIDYLSDIIENI